MASANAVTSGIARHPLALASSAAPEGLQRHLDRLGPVVGASRAMQEVFRLVRRVAKSSASVLITGDTGTGKELIAQAIHAASLRSRQPFLPVNCGAVSATLIESELFGHERGSFTGADRLHKGFFEQADRGTLFLDEITEMPVELQVRLLRVLETGIVRRVGGSAALKVDVRIIAATNQSPEQAVAAGRLRQDLLYRLNVFPIGLPALRDREDDVLLLARTFLAQLNAQEGTAKQFDPDCFGRLRRHLWAGNVRELRNVVQRAFILAEGELGTELLNLSDLKNSRPALGAGLVTPVGTSLAESEKRLILATVDHFGGDKHEAALALGTSVKTVYNRLREYKTRN